jgi:hypothetical protein
MVTKLVIKAMGKLEKACRTLSEKLSRNEEHKEK